MEGNATSSLHDMYDELLFYTLAHKDPAFIHQHVVDAFAAAAGEKRDTMIHKWCESVWEAFSANRETVSGLLEQEMR